MVVSSIPPLAPTHTETQCNADTCHIQQDFATFVGEFGLRPGDCIFDYLTFSNNGRRSVVLVPPMARIILVDGGSPTFSVFNHGQAPPRGNATFHWLPGVMIHATTLDRYVAPWGSGGDSGIEESFESLFVDAEEGEDEARFQRRLKKWLNQNFKRYCTDDLHPRSQYDVKLRSMLNVLVAQRRHLARVLNLDDESCWDNYRATDEVTLICEVGSLQLRFHLWYGSEGTGYHSHIDDDFHRAFVSAVLFGSMTHLIHDRHGGPQVGVRGGTSVFFWDSGERTPIAEEGHLVTVSNGSHYLYPARWIHTVQSHGPGFSVELRLVDGEDCLDDPIKINVFNEEDAGHLGDRPMSKEAARSLRQQVAHVLQEGTFDAEVDQLIAYARETLEAYED